jgi:hypothetical protein
VATTSVQQTTPADIRSSLSTELARYLDEPLQPLVATPQPAASAKTVSKIKFPTDPVVWWGSNAARFPLLSRVARKYFSAPASSVCSERLFSTAGHIITDERSRLDPDRAEMLLFLNRNLSR